MSFLQHKFYSSAFQHYISGRFAVFAGLLPAGGNSLRLGVELALKGRLAATVTMDDLKSTYGHNIKRAWRDFKSVTQTPMLSKHDTVIDALFAFEEIRYPDKMVRDGATITFTPGEVSVAQPPSTSRTVPEYEIVLGQVDALMLDIFRSSSVNWRAIPLLKSEASVFLHRDNSHFLLQ